MSRLRAAPRILLVKLSSLGDVIHAMPVVHDILAARPEAVVDWVVEPAFAPLVRRVQGVAQVIDCPQRAWRRRGLAGWFAADVRAQRRALRAALQAWAYDCVIDLQGLTKSALVARRARLAPGGARVAMANRTDGSGYEAPTRWLADRAVRLPPHIHALDRARELAAQALGYVVQGRPDFGLHAAQAASADAAHAASADAARAAAAAPQVVFVHGTSRADKLWPEAHWLALAQRFLQQGWRIALPHGDAAEEQRARRWAAALGTPAVTVWPRSDLGTLLDRLGAAQGVVGVDSGLSHLAVALGLPHVQVYNHPTAWRTGPQPHHGHRHQVSVGGDGVPGVDAVWAAWQGVAPAAGATVQGPAPAAGADAQGGDTA